MTIRNGLDVSASLQCYFCDIIDKLKHFVPGSNEDTKVKLLYSVYLSVVTTNSVKTESSG